MLNSLKVKRYLSILALTALMFSLSACKLDVLNPKGLIAAGEKQIFLISTGLMLLVVIPVILLSFIFAYKYRAGNKKADYAPNWADSTVLEVIWWAIPCLIVGMLAAYTWTTSHELDPYKPLEVKNRKVLIIQAISLQWKWLFIYPEQHIASLNFIQIPVGRPVRFLITAEGPMNSIQIPQLVGQIYAMAGMQTKLNFIADEAGLYKGVSANFTGDGFSEMKFNVRAGTESEFSAWVKKAEKASTTLGLKQYQQLLKPSINNSTPVYALAEHDLFDTVVMKGMHPAHEPMKAMAHHNHH